MRPKGWRCGECGIVLTGDVDVEAHFETHPVPPDAGPGPPCTHAALVVDVTPGRVYLWAGTEGKPDAPVDANPGWRHWRAPPVVKDIVERENRADLATPGWYYPHTRSSAAALDRLYHEMVRATGAISGPAAAGTARTRPEPTITREDIRAALLRPESRRNARIVAVLELSAALIAGVVGTNVMYICTSYVPFDGCDTRNYGAPGFVLLMIGICLGLVGIASLFSTLGKDITELPPEWQAGARGDPRVEAGAERLASVTWAAILMSVLVTVEAFPIYNLVVLTSSGQHPTFNLGAFLVDMAFFGIADVLIVFLIVTYGSNN